MTRQDTGYRCPVCAQTVRVLGINVKDAAPINETRPTHRTPTCGHHGTTSDARKPAEMERQEEGK